MFLPVSLRKEPIRIFRVDYKEGLANLVWKSSLVNLTCLTWVAATAEVEYYSFHSDRCPASAWYPTTPESCKEGT